MAKFKPGQSGNKKGRPPGPSEVTAKQREVFKAVIANEIDQLPEILGRLDDKTRLELIIKLLPFAIPKMGSFYEID
jgi:hypothetical protein